MKFYGTKGMYLTDHKTHKVIGKFDENGEFETKEEKIIKRMKPLFKYESNTFKCKKCDYETDNKGLLLAHYREKHPKKED